MKLVAIAINNCSSCPNNKDTHIHAFQGRGFLSECRFREEPRLIQKHDEEYGPFPEWCPLPDFNE